jgi:hypothetical protein
MMINEVDKEHGYLHSYLNFPAVFRVPTGQWNEWAFRIRSAGSRVPAVAAVDYTSRRSPLARASQEEPTERERSAGCIVSSKKGCMRSTTLPGCAAWAGGVCRVIINGEAADYAARLPWWCGGVRVSAVNKVDQANQ